MNVYVRSKFPCRSLIHGVGLCQTPQTRLPFEGREFDSCQIQEFDELVFTKSFLKGGCDTRPVFMCGNSVPVASGKNFPVDPVITGSALSTSLDEILPFGINSF